MRDLWFDAIWSPLILKFDPRKHKTIDGQAGNEDNYGVAFVSTYRNSNRLFQGDSLEGLITTAVHEIGHIFGLIHHNEFIRLTEKTTSDGTLCAMSFANEKGETVKNFAETHF